jgi:hypothetical protein
MAKIRSVQKAAQTERGNAEGEETSREEGHGEKVRGFGRKPEAEVGWTPEAL